MPREVPQEEVDEAVAELNKVRSEWMKRPGVTAVDVGFKITDTEITDELAIRVHVKRKLPRAAVPEYELFPDHIGSFSVDVIEADYGPQSVSGPETLE